VDDLICMSSLAFPSDAAPRRAARFGVPALFSERSSEVLLGVVVLTFAAALLTSLPGEFGVDSWLELVAGRAVWQSGIPHHETLTVIAQGAQWVDQQWLSQLASYAIYLLGGLGLLGIVNVGLFAGAAAGSVAASRRLGAPFRSVLVALPLCIVLIAPAREVRTQEFAMPLFVGLTYLLARDSRSPSRRVYWCLPILVLWANLHGTVTLGAMLVALRGVTVAWERRHSLRHSPSAWRRPAALILGAPLAILLTPYGLGIVGYYRTTLLGSTLRHTVSEWQPITTVPVIAAALFIVAGLAIWSFGRDRTRTTSWERIALVVLAAGSISVMRNVLFFGLFAMMILPLSLSLGASNVTVSSDRRRGAINATIAGIAVLAVVITTAGTLLRPAPSIELSYQRTGVLHAVQNATRSNPSLKLLADDRFSDWLLWRDPALDGRIANDVRYELLTAGQIHGIVNVLTVTGPAWKQGARGYRLLVLDRKYDPAAVRAFRSEPGSRVLYNDGERIVILRNAGEAA
jgi:hypothetical protein